MSSLQEQTQVLYEIAMDIGGSMDLQVMLKRSIQTMLRKLDGLGGVVLADRQDGEQYWLEEVFATPPNIRRNPAYAQAVADLPTSNPPGTGRTHWPDPRPHPAGNVYYYHFDLAGFGVLVLLKARPLDPALARSLRPICDRLAESCIACETAQALAKNRETLRASEERYRDLHENAPNAYFSVGVDGRIHECNRRAGELLEYAVEELVGRPVLDLYADTLCGKKKAAKVLEQFRAGETVCDQELQMQKADGTPVWISLTLNAIRDAQGRVAESRSMVVDISERKRAQAALQDSENRYRAILNALPDLMFVHSRDGKYLDYHATNPDALYVPPKQFLGKKVQDVLPGDVASTFLTLIERAIVTNKMQIYEYQLLIAGRPRYFEARIVPYGKDRALSIIREITERKRAETALRQRATQLALLNEIGGRVAAFLDLDEVFDRAAQLVQERCGFHHVGLFTKTSGEDRLVMKARAGKFAPLFPRDHNVALGQGMVGWVGLHGETLLANDVDVEPHYVNPYPDRLPTHSELSVPIRIGDEIVGVLDLQSPQPNAFDSSDVTTLETLADQVAVAIHNARLFETERAAREHAEKLQAATQALSATLDLQQVFERILTELRYVVPYDSASVQQLEENRLVIIGGHGFPNLEELLGESFDLAAQDNPNYKVVRTKNPLILDDAQAHFEGFRREPHAQASIRAWLGVPLLFGDRLIGMIALDKREPGFYTKEHAQLALAFAAQAAIAIENARLFHETQRRNRELTLLNRVIAATAAVGEAFEPILEIVCRELALAFEVPQAAAALFNEEKTEAVVVAEYLTPGRPPSLGERIPVAGNLASQHLLTRKTPLVIDDAQTDPRQAPIHDLLRRRGTVSLLLLPLMVDGEVVGSLGVDAIEPRVFSAQEVNLAWRVAEQASGVLAQARLREERRQLEGQFHHAQKMEAIGRLAGGIAHDFNNLLTVIHLSTRLLERKLHPEDPRQPHVEHIRDASQRAANLTKRLLAFSRREIVEPQVLDLNQVLGELDKMLQRLIGEDVELTLLLSGELWPVKVDPTQVEQVVINLAVNARDAMLSGGKLTIETANVVLDEAYATLHLEVEPGQYVMLAVSDNGVGMSDEVKAHLFEPFFTTKRKGKGSGLGLATVFGIVKQNRGHIGVYSEVDQGTTFKIYLPRFAEDAHVPSPRPPAYAEPSARGSETVLVVEDEAPVRKLMQTILTTQGYRVLTAEDGVEALQIAQRHAGPIHLLLTDVVMPRMSGKALADRLRPSRPEMRVLYTSGYTDNAIVHHGVLDEDTHLLSKPFDLETLISQVRDVLDNRV